MAKPALKFSKFNNKHLNHKKSRPREHLKINIFHYLNSKKYYKNFQEQKIQNSLKNLNQQSKAPSKNPKPIPKLMAKETNPNGPDLLKPPLS